MSTRPITPQARRRRPTAQQYRRRRVVALVLAVVLVGGGYIVVQSARGGAGQASASSAPATVAALGADPTAPGASVPVGSAPAAGEPTTTTAPIAATTGGVPSAENPWKLYIAGDSDAGAFAPYLEKLMKASGMLTTTLDYKVSSGLARPDFFDWPAHFTTELPQVNPDIVVVTFGGNDSQGLTNQAGTFIVQVPKGGDSADAEWRAEYGRRVGAAMDQLTAGGRALIWVGIPNDNNPDVTNRLAVQDQVVREEVSAHPGVVFIDTWARFSGRNGGWADFVIDPRDNEGKEVRRSDGFHLNQTGAEILALDIATAIKQVLTDHGATL
jgi:hypothetical protein